MECCAHIHVPPSMLRSSTASQPALLRSSLPLSKHHVHACSLGTPPKPFRYAWPHHTLAQVPQPVSGLCAHVQPKCRIL
jgi:hypothetical protein